MKDIILGLIRHALTFGGGYLVTKGLTDAAGSEQLVGAITTVVGAAWSIYEKVKAAKTDKPAA